MYGWINGSLEELILERHGIEAWQRIKEQASCQDYVNQFNRNVNYPDDTTYRLLLCAAEYLQVSVSLIIEELGAYFLHYVRKHGYETTMRRQGTNFYEWLHNMNEPHRLLKSRFPTSLPPKFLVVPREQPNEVELHYYSERYQGMFSSLVVGIIREVAKFYFNLEANMQLTKSEMLSDTMFHGTWIITTSPVVTANPTIIPMATTNVISEDNPTVSSPELKCPFSGKSISVNNATNTRSCPYSSSSQQISTQIASPVKSPQPVNNSVVNNIGFAPKHVMKHFPFHIVINQEMQIIQLGDKMLKFFRRNFAHLYESVLLSDINSFFSIISPPNSELTWTSLLCLTDCDVELEVKNMLLNNCPIHFRGSLTVFQADKDGNTDQDCIMFFINPDIRHLEEMDSMHLKLSDFPRHSFQRDLLLLREHLRSETDLAINLQELSSKLDEERKKTLQALRTKGIFVRYASHEIRTPLNITMLGLSYLEEEMLRSVTMAEDHDAMGPFREVLLDVKRSCHSAVDILNDLLLYEKLESGGIFSLSCVEVSLSKFLRDSVTAFRIQCQSSDIELKIEQDDSVDGIILNIDKTKLGQVLRNFVSNGLKFTPRNGSITVSCLVYQYPLDSEIDTTMMTCTEPQKRDHKKFNGIDICFTEDFPSTSSSGFIRIAVSDTGPGITWDDQKSLFQEFAQVNAEQLQNGQGSGLGLWIAKSITKMHGGRVGVASKLGQGATFLADIPIHHIVSTPSRLDSLSSSSIMDGDDSSSVSSVMNYLGLSRFPDTPAAIIHGERRMKSLTRNELVLDHISDDSDSPNIESPTKRSKRNHPTEERFLVEHEDFEFESMSRKPSIVEISPRRHNVLNMSCTSSVDSVNEQQSVMSQSQFEYRILQQDLLDILSKKNILIVDDISMNRKIVRRLLQDKFQSMGEAENGVEAIKMINLAQEKHQPYDIIMMDYFMPVMNGLEATKQIRELSFGKNCIILGVTGNGMQSDIDSFMQAGADHVLVKPLNLDSFFDILHQKLQT